MTTATDETYAARRGAAMRHLVAELHAYAATKREIARLTADVAEAGMSPALDRQTYGRHSSPIWSNPTAVRASELADNPLLGYMQGVVRAIDETLEAADPETRALIEVTYWRRHGAYRIAADSDSSTRTLCRRRADVLREIAAGLGWPH